MSKVVYSNSINILALTGIMIVTLSGVGLAPYGMKWLFEGERPRSKDHFEKLMVLLPQWRKEKPGYVARVDPDEAWRAEHKALGNGVEESARA